MNSHKEKLQKLMDPLVATLFPARPRRWGKQFRSDGKVQYTEKKTTLQDTDLIEHFTDNRKEIKKWGTAISIKLWTEDDVLGCVVLDLDSPDWVRWAKTLIIPELDKQGAEPIFEASENEHGEERGHVWIKVDATKATCKEFFESVLSTCGLKKDSRLEIFPLDGDRLVRLFGGLHLKSMKRHGFVVDGEEIADPAQMIELFLDAKVITREQMQACLGPVKPIPEQLHDGVSRSEKLFLARSLPRPVDQMPKELSKITANCQAYNSLIKQVENGRLDQDGTHEIGLHLAGLAMALDGRKGTTGSNASWMKDFFNAHRSTSFEHHNWFHPQEETEKLSANCVNLDERFGACGDCPLKKRNGWNPKYFMDSWREVKRVPLRDQLLPVSHDTVRSDVFPRLNMRVLKLLGTSNGN